MSWLLICLSHCSRDAHAVALKLSDEAAAICKLTWAEGSRFKVHVQGPWREFWGPCEMGLLLFMTKLTSGIWHPPERVIQSKGQIGSHHAFYDLVSKFVHSHFYFIIIFSYMYWLGVIHQVHLTFKGMRVLLFEEDFKKCVDIFQITVRTANKFTQHFFTKQNMKSLVIVKVMTFSWIKWLRLFFMTLEALLAQAQLNRARINACVKAAIYRPDNDVLHGFSGTFCQLRHRILNIYNHTNSLPSFGKYDYEVIIISYCYCKGLLQTCQNITRLY